MNRQALAEFKDTGQAFSLGAAVQTLLGHSAGVSAVAFSPDSKLLASGSDDLTARLRDGRFGATPYTLKGYSHWLQAWVTAVAFSSDGKLLTSASLDKTVRLWGGRSRAALQTLRGRSDRVKTVAFSPDGKLRASASFDKTVMLWDGRLQFYHNTYPATSSTATVLLYLL